MQMRWDSEKRWLWLDCFCTTRPITYLRFHLANVSPLMVLLCTVFYMITICCLQSARIHYSEHWRFVERHALVLRLFRNKSLEMELTVLGFGFCQLECVPHIIPWCYCKNEKHCHSLKTLLFHYSYMQDSIIMSWLFGQSEGWPLIWKTWKCWHFDTCQGNVMEKSCYGKVAKKCILIVAYSLTYDHLAASSYCSITGMLWILLNM